MWRPRRGSLCWLVTLTKSVQSLSDPEDCPVKGPHNWMLTDWLGTGSRLSWDADYLYQHRRFEEIPFHNIFGISCIPLLDSKRELQYQIFKWNIWSFVSLCEFLKFVSLNSADFSAIIHHKRDTSALYNFSFCHHYTRLASGF